MKRTRYIQPQTEHFLMVCHEHLAAGSPGKTNVDDYSGTGQGNTGLGGDTGEGDDEDDPDAKAFNIWEAWD